MIKPVNKSSFKESCESTIEKIIRDVEILERFYLKKNEFLRNEIEILEVENEKLKKIIEEGQKIGKTLIDLTNKVLGRKNPNEENFKNLLEAHRDFVEKVFFEYFQ